MEGEGRIDRAQNFQGNENPLYDTMIDMPHICLNS